jgi:glycine/serine hydroxymethyltransferase
MSASTSNLHYNNFFETPGDSPLAKEKMLANTADLRINHFFEMLGEARLAKDRCVNLIASENVLSERVREALSSPLALRYCIDDFPNVQELMALCSCVDEALKKLFHAPYVCTAPLSGMNAMQITIRSLTPDGGTVYILSPEHGGHPNTPSILSAFGLRAQYLPYDCSRCVIDTERLPELFRSVPPNLIYIDNSLVLFMPDIGAIKRTAEPFTAPVVYDASHVLGLIAGSAFPNPLELGADVVCGSTHKTFFGPQKGIILLSSDELARKVDDFAQVFISSTHATSLFALYVAADEFLQFGEQYARQTVLNARSLGRALANRGLSVVGLDYGISDSHQVWVECDGIEASVAQSRLAVAGINCNAALMPSSGRMGLRFGTAEVTRRGYGELEMQTLAGLIDQALRENPDLSFVCKQATSLAGRFSSIKYC